MKGDKKNVTLEEFTKSIVSDIEDAIDFTIIEFREDLEQADDYFNGECDLELEENRSQIVYTHVRDSIRNLRPSILRILLHNRNKLVKYIPTNPYVADQIEQQQAFVHQAFWKAGGYNAIYGSIDESMMHKFGPIKTYWVPNPSPHYMKFTYLTPEDVEQLRGMENTKILSEEPCTLLVGEEDADEMEFFDVEVEYFFKNGEIRVEASPFGEFFISRNARNTEDARVHGSQRAITVSEAIDMGIDYSGNWFDLSYDDPENTRASGIQDAKRGYNKREEKERGDVLGHKFLYTEAYIRADLDDLGYDQLYCFIFGGTDYKRLDYYRISETPWDIVSHDPIAFSPIGHSIAEIAIPEQDTITSLSRAALDNVHSANSPSLAGNPATVNFDDIMNVSIGYPVRTRGTDAIQVINTPNQAQNTLPMLTWMQQLAQDKLGITRASQGLDPDAMQSTDKNAIMNTIQLGQSQVELMVRNIIETGLIHVFRKMLMLSIEHFERYQTAIIRGKPTQVDLLRFDPWLQAQATVGLGTVENARTLQGLNSILGVQMQIYQGMGVNNPFVSATNIYNTLEDISEEQGIYNVHRYFNEVTPEVEQQFAQAQAAQAKEMEAAKRGTPTDPAAALVTAEQMKSKSSDFRTLLDHRAKAGELQLRALEAQNKDDLERDKMEQDRTIKAGKIFSDTGFKIDEAAIKREQSAQRVMPNRNGNGSAQ